MVTAAVALETDNICDLDNYFIFAIYDILEDKWHIFSFVLLIVFSHEYHKEHGVFQAKNPEPLYAK